MDRKRATKPGEGCRESSTKEGDTNLNTETRVAHTHYHHRILSYWVMYAVLGGLVSAKGDFVYQMSNGTGVVVVVVIIEYWRWWHY